MKEQPFCVTSQKLEVEVEVITAAYLQDQCLLLDNWRRRARGYPDPRNVKPSIGVGASVLRRSFARSQHSTPRPLTPYTPPTPAVNSPPLPIGLLWLLSLRHVGCRHALRRSSCATMARGEVSISPIRHRNVADNPGAALHAGQPSLAAQNFNMPALSPTMTEGNIATWKIKEGTTDPSPQT